MSNNFLILVVNVGSTSFKFKLFDMEDCVVLSSGRFERIGENNSPYQYKGENGIISGNINTEGGYKPAIDMALALLKDDEFIKDTSDIDVVAFKAVMCGEDYHTTFINDDVLGKMQELSFVAPVHNMPYIAAINDFADKVGNEKIVLAFENEFHKTIPDYAKVSSINYEHAEKYKIKKHGYHGASHAYVADVISKSYGDSKKIISCHLGGSSSVCAIKDGRSFDISMDFSPQSGVPMAERIGDTDVFSVLYLMHKENISPKEMRDILCYKSGLKGISGKSGDMRDLAEDNGERAKLAIKNYAYWVRKYIGAYTALLNGVDVLCFTGGIGENSHFIRKIICENLNYLGIVLSDEKNESPITETLHEINDANSSVKIVIIPSNEELIVAKKAYELIQRRCLG